MVVRTFIEPPHAPGGHGAGKPASEGKTRGQPGPGRPKTGPEIAGRHKGKARGRHRHAMACSSLNIRLVAHPREDTGRDNGIGGWQALAAHSRVSGGRFL